MIYLFQDNSCFKRKTERQRERERGCWTRWSNEQKVWTKLWTSQMKMSSDSEKHQRKINQVLYLWIIDASVSGCWLVLLKKNILVTNSPFVRRFLQSNFQVENITSQQEEKKIWQRRSGAGSRYMFAIINLVILDTSIVFMFNDFCFSEFFSCRCN